MTPSGTTDGAESANVIKVNGQVRGPRCSASTKKNLAFIEQAALGRLRTGVADPVLSLAPWMRHTDVLPIAMNNTHLLGATTDGQGGFACASGCVLMSVTSEPHT